MTVTSPTPLKNLKILKKRGEVKNEGLCWRWKPICSLKQVLGH